MATFGENAVGIDHTVTIDGPDKLKRISADYLDELNDALNAAETPQERSRYAMAISATAAARAWDARPADLAMPLDYDHQVLAVLDEIFASLKLLVSVVPSGAGIVSGRLDRIAAGLAAARDSFSDQKPDEVLAARAAKPADKPADKPTDSKPADKPASKPAA